MTCPFTLDIASAVRRAKERGSLLGTFVTTRFDEALAEAVRRAAEPPRSELHGVPYGLKDEWDTAGLPTTGGSWRHRNRTPTVSHPIHTVLEAAGAVLLGKTNLSDLGLPPEATSWVGGATRNPWDLRRTAGGSSGGAAAAVADGQVAFALGRYTIYRDRRPILARVRAVRDAFDAEWERGQIIVAPVCSYPAPLVGRSNWNPWLLASTIPGNLADATGLAIPFGYFDGPLPRAIQLLGPPGSEALLLDLAERIIAARDANQRLQARPSPERAAP